MSTPIPPLPKWGKIFLPCVRHEGTTRGLLELPLEVLANIFRLLQLGEHSCRTKTPGLEAFRQVSKAARKVADATVDLLCYDYEVPQSLACLRMGPLSLVLLRHYQSTLAADLARCPNACRLEITFPLSPAHLHRWLLTLADSQPNLQTLAVTLEHPRPKEAGPPPPPGHFSTFSRFPHLHQLSLHGLLISPSTLTTISTLPALRTLALHVLNNRDFPIPCMPRLLSLTLEGSCGKDDDPDPAKPARKDHERGPLLGIDSTGSRWSGLETLRLTACRLPQPWHVRPGTFPRLTRLKVSKVKNWAVVALNFLALTVLEEVEIGPCQMRKTGPTSGVAMLQKLQTLKLLPCLGLSSLHSLRSLSIAGVDLRRSFNVEPLSLLTCLRTLHVSCPLSYEEPKPLLPPLSGLTLLEDLSLTNCSPARPIGGGAASGPPGVPESKAWPELGALTGLTSLSLRNVDVDELSGMESLSRLEKLFLSNNLYLKQMPDLGHLTALHTLVAISLPMHRMPQLEAVTSLRVLHIEKLWDYLAGRGPFSGLCQLPPLGHLRLLRDLKLKGVGSRELPWLESLESLESLTLADFRLEELPPLTALSSLRVLHLKKLTLKSLSPVHGLTSLRELSLCALDDVKLGEGRLLGLPLCTALLNLEIGLMDGAEESLGDAVRLPRLRTLTVGVLPRGSRKFEVPGSNVLVVTGKGRCGMKSEAEYQRESGRGGWSGRARRAEGAVRL